MASGGKKKTTMAKLDRERRMRERRMDKKARKDARKLASTQPIDGDSETPDGHEPAASDHLQAPRPALQPAGSLPADR